MIVRKQDELVERAGHAEVRAHGMLERLGDRLRQERVEHHVRLVVEDLREQLIPTPEHIVQGARGARSQGEHQPRPIIWIVDDVES